MAKGSMLPSGQQVALRRTRTGTLAYSDRTFEGVEDFIAYVDGIPKKQKYNA